MACHPDRSEAKGLCVSNRLEPDKMWLPHPNVALLATLGWDFHCRINRRLFSKSRRTSLLIHHLRHHVRLAPEKIEVPAIHRVDWSRAHL